MNSKGELAIITGVVLLVSMVIGVFVVDSVSCGFCQCTDAPAMPKTLVVNVWNNASCVGDKCLTDWGVTCNSTELTAGVDYNIDDCNVQLTNATWNNTVCYLDYTYEGSYYQGTDILGVIVCNIPIIMGAAGLALGAIWLYMKGGF